ncbi:Hypothetical protein Minf_1390 [Methylacidiphilum infernorum V4]|uniref:Uncharacterized protein n=1 Tax=Methylacidiphilum infernorum (isolate V4) TaxID=481448 RepID=B3DVU1_METI4|nr:Hypothetical protein Minf_1390 [Methylacidiphilum infernorum V4]
MQGTASSLFSKKNIEKIRELSYLKTCLRRLPGYR